MCHCWSFVREWQTQGKLRAPIVKMSLKSLILGRVAAENEIYLLVYGNCTAPSVIFLQTSLNNCPHPQSVWRVGSPWPAAPAECSVFVVLCTSRNEGCIVHFLGLSSSQLLHSPNECSVPFGLQESFVLAGCSLVFLRVFINLGLAWNKVYCFSLFKGGIKPPHSVSWGNAAPQIAQCRLSVLLELV